MSDAAEGPPWRRLSQLPYAFGGPAGRGVIRATAEDFQVDELLGFTPDGEGEHLLLQIRKRHTNTLWLARQLARVAGIPARDVGYAGLKDRHAVTTQWFSIHLAGRAEPDWSPLLSGQIELLSRQRHRRKLRTGALLGNRFHLWVRALQADPRQLLARLEQLRRRGLPNYFGEQRFGHDYANLQQAQALFERRLGRIERRQRGLYISAARSQLFNQVLGARIEQASWERPLTGDQMLVTGSRSQFPAGQPEPLLQRRCRGLEIHPSGPLWGRGRPLVSGEALALEEAALRPFGAWRDGLEHVGLQQQRRALRVLPGELSWDLSQAGSLGLEFTLPAGSYATVLLRELLEARAAQP